jgi:hypothetical protein
MNIRPVWNRLLATASMVAPISVAVVSVTATAAPLRAQAWKEIGKTASNSVVSIDPKSVKRVNDTVTVVMRTRFAAPDGDGITGTRTVATFNCANQKVAIKENDSYKGTRVVKKSIPKIPGYGAVFGGSLTGVAYDYLCAKKK